MIRAGKMHGGALVSSISAVRLAIAASLLTSFSIQAAEPALEDLRHEVELLRKQIAASTQLDPVQKQLATRAGVPFVPNAPVMTKAGKLRIGGLLQVWAYSIQNDNAGVEDVPQAIVSNAGSAARNEEADNDSFRVRRAEIRFALDIHENISAFVTIDPAREATAFPSFPDNQASAGSGDHSAYFFDPCQCDGPIADPRGIGAGVGTGNRMLQDAYINYHGVIPHHDVSIGQFKRRLGEEGTRDSGMLDFAERAIITQPAELRDLGLQAHGTWWNDRFQYWVGLFDGAGSAFQQRSNRSDDNDAKDVSATLQIQPLKHETWGNLELGYSLLYGIEGEAAGFTPGTTPINGLNRNETVRVMQYAWASYAPGGPVRGWWTRGEWGLYRDRFAPSQAASGEDVFSTDPAPFNIQGWYVSTGYHLGRSRFAGCAPQFLRSTEFAFRYESAQNIFFHDLVLPERRFDLFKTQVYTAGINYYVKGQNVKVQLNYNWVVEEDNVDKDDRQLRETRNNSLVLSLQTLF
jgi:hypothetical protein